MFIEYIKFKFKIREKWTVNDDGQWDKYHHLGSLKIVELIQKGKHSLKSKPLSNIHGRIQTKLKPFLFHVCKEKLLGVITQEVDVLQQNTDRSIIYVCSLEG